MFTGIIQDLALLVDVQASSNTSNLTFTFQTALISQLKVSDSVAHDGVCLSVEKLDPSSSCYQVSAVQRSLEKTTLSQLFDTFLNAKSAKAAKFAKSEFARSEFAKSERERSKGEKHYVNIETALKSSARLEGHFLQGHVDTTGIVREISDHNGSMEFLISCHKKYRDLVVKRGSIAISGISLTVAEIFDFSDPAEGAQEKKKLEKIKKASSTDNLGQIFFLSVHIIPHTLQNTGASHWQIDQALNIEFDILGKYITQMHRKYIKNN